MEGFESFVGVNFWTALFCLINTLIIFFVMKKFLFGPISKMIAERQKEIDDLYADANASKANAHELEAEYSEKLASAGAESDRILREATRQAQAKEEEILRSAQAKAARTLERAQEQIELEKKQAVNDLKDQVSDVALEIASKVLQEEVDGRRHEKLINSFIDQLGE